MTTPLKEYCVSRDLRTCLPCIGITVVFQFIIHQDSVCSKRNLLESLISQEVQTNATKSNKITLSQVLARD